MNVVKG